MLRIRSTSFYCTKRVSWRQKNPAIRLRLFYWLLTNRKQEEAENVDITPAIRTDSLSLLCISVVENKKHDLRLFEDEEYVNNIKERSREWIEENREVQDLRVL